MTYENAHTSNAHEELQLSNLDRVDGRGGRRLVLEGGREGRTRVTLLPERRYPRLPNAKDREWWCHPGVPRASKVPPAQRSPRLLLRTLTAHAISSAVRNDTHGDGTNPTDYYVRSGFVICVWNCSTLNAMLEPTSGGTGRVFDLNALCHLDHSALSKKWFARR